MKYTKTYGMILRALSFLLALTLVLGGASLPVLAEAETDTETSPYMTWAYFSSTGLVNGHDPQTDTLYRYSPVTMISARIRFMPDGYFQYANTIEMEDGMEATVLSPGFGSDFIVVDGTLMATNAGKQYLNSLAKYKSGFTEYRLVSDSLSAYVSEGFYTALQNTDGAASEKHSLFDLRNTPCYTLLGFDQDRWFGVPVAFIYEMEDGLYYASALYLGEDCYGEEGELLPKSKTYLNLYPLSEEMTAEAYRAIRDVNFRLPHYTYESKSSLMGDPAEGGVTVAIVSIAVLGILLPAAPITLGLCLPRSQKLGRKKRWYLLAALGGAWLVLGILVLILTIVAL